MPKKLLKQVTWAEGDTPTGSVHNLGEFSRNYNPKGASFGNKNLPEHFDQVVEQR